MKTPNQPDPGAKKTSQWVQKRQSYFDWMYVCTFQESTENQHLSLHHSAESQSNTLDGHLEFQNK